MNKLLTKSDLLAWCLLSAETQADLLNQLHRGSFMTGSCVHLIYSQTTVNRSVFDQHRITQIEQNNKTKRTRTGKQTSFLGFDTRHDSTFQESRIWYALQIEEIESCRHTATQKCRCNGPVELHPLSKIEYILPLCTNTVRGNPRGNLTEDDLFDLQIGFVNCIWVRWDKCFKARTIE